MDPRCSAVEVKVLEIGNTQAKYKHLKFVLMHMHLGKTTRLPYTTVCLSVRACVVVDWLWSVMCLQRGSAELSLRHVFCKHAEEFYLS